MNGTRAKKVPVWLPGESEESSASIEPDICRLEVMMSLQRDLSDRVSVNLEDLNAADRAVKVAWICKMFIAAIVELVEMLNCIPWKWWKKNQSWEQDKLEEEFVDVFHFVLNIGILIGFTPDTLFEAYLNKNKVNHNRQDNNY